MTLIKIKALTSFTFAVVLLKKKFAICIPIARICFQQSPAEHEIVDTMPECILYNKTNVV